MKKLLLVMFVVSAGLTAAMLYDQLVVEQSLGPAAMAAIAVGSAFSLFVLATLLLYGTRYGELMGKLWLASISVLVTYVALDVIVGFILIQPLSPPLIPDEYRHHKLVPNSYARLEMRDFSYVQRVNNFGLRGEDVTVEKGPEIVRILMLGDSFTMGKGVEDHETFSTLLEGALNTRLTSCGGRSVQILNAGVDGYSPILSYTQLTRELYPLKPDMIVLNLDMNDLVGEAAYRRDAVRGPDGEIIGVPGGRERVSPIERFRSWSERHLFFTRVLVLKINELLEYRDVRSAVTHATHDLLAHTLETDTTPREAQWRDLFDSVLKIKAFADQHGASFMLTTYPHAHQVNEREGIPGRYYFVPENAVISDKSVGIITQFAADHGMKFVSAFPLFRGYGGADPLYFNHDTHWTPAGHRVMAKALEAYMAEQFIPAWCE